MAFKRRGEDGPTRPGAEPDVKIVDELVKKSLQVNPSLRKGMDTQGVLENLRAEALGRSRAGSSPPSGSTSAPAVSLGGSAPRPAQDPLLQTISIFVGQKAQDFPAQRRALSEERRAVEAELRARLADLDARARELAAQTQAEIIGLLRPLLQSGADPEGAQKTLAGFGDLLSELGTSAGELVREARKK